MKLLTQHKAEGKSGTLIIILLFIILFSTQKRGPKKYHSIVK